MATTSTNRVNTPATSSNARNVLAAQPQAATKLRKIAEGETFAQQTKMLESGRLETRFSVKPDETVHKLDRYEVVTVFDFRSASPAEIQQLAMKACIIGMQRNFREAFKANEANALNAAQWAAVNVKTDIIDAARKSTDPVAKAKSAMLKAGLSKADLLALLSAMPD